MESAGEKNTAKILSAVFIAYFILLSIVCLAVLVTKGTHGFGGRQSRWFSFSAYVFSLQFFVLAIGVVRDKRQHEELLGKSLLVLFLGGLPTIYLVYNLLD